MEFCSASYMKCEPWILLRAARQFFIRVCLCWSSLQTVWPGSVQLRPTRTYPAAAGERERHLFFLHQIKNFLETEQYILRNEKTWFIHLPWNENRLKSEGLGKNMLAKPANRDQNKKKSYLKKKNQLLRKFRNSHLVVNTETLFEDKSFEPWTPPHAYNTSHTAYDTNHTVSSELIGCWTEDIGLN